MIGIFKQKNPINVLLLLIFGVLIKLPVFLHPSVSIAKEEDGLLFQAIIQLLQPVAKSFPAIYSCIAFGLLFMQALILNMFMNNQRMLKRPSYFPGMAYLLITSLFPVWNNFSAPLIINTILLYVFTSLFNIYYQQNVKGVIFNIGLSIGLAAFLYFPAISLIGWILFALLIMRPFRLNEWLLFLVGVITPYFFYNVYLFMKDQWSFQWPYFVINLPSLAQSIWLPIAGFLLLFPFLIGAYYIQDNLRRMLIQVRKGWSLMLLYLVGVLFIPFVNNSKSFENWVMIAIPFAAFHAGTYVYSTSKVLQHVIFWITVVFILFYQYYGPGW